MNRADAIQAVNTMIRLLHERLGFTLDFTVPSHNAMLAEAIEVLSGPTVSEVCDKNVKFFLGRGHVYSHPSWGTTNCVFCGKPKP